MRSLAPDGQDEHDPGTIRRAGGADEVRYSISRPPRRPASICRRCSSLSPMRCSSEQLRECRLLALLGPREMSDVSPHSGPKADIDQVTVTNRDFMSTRPRVCTHK